MAKNIELTCRIHEIKQIPNTRSYLLSIEYKQGDKSWFKPWRFTPTKPVSMEWLEQEVAKLDPWPEEDYMKNVMEEKDKSFKIAVKPDQKVEEAKGIGNAVESLAPEPQQQQIAVPPGTILE